MEIKNYLGYDLYVYASNDDKEPVKLISRGSARSISKKNRVSEVEIKDRDRAMSVPVLQEDISGLDDFPEYDEGVLLVVGRIAAEGARKKGRTTKDLIIPCGYVKNEKKQILGCKTFEKFETIQ